MCRRGEYLSFEDFTSRYGRKRIYHGPDAVPHVLNLRKKIEDDVKNPATLRLTAAADISFPSNEEGCEKNRQPFCVAEESKGLQVLDCVNGGQTSGGEAQPRATPPYWA